ncbi:MAG: methionine--tRNA ligase, partial [Bacteroidales bacterium]|nr:methionine--tRNA ligase [Bacteroidales bacterium]
AGVYIPADIYVRYLRLANEDVVFIGGSDEHGIPITIKARNEGITPQDVVDRYHEMIKHSFEEFGIGFDIYSRTTDPVHYKTASDFFLKLYNDNKFIEKTTQQYYDEEAKQFLADRYITGTCPHCSNERAYGDQCEACGTSLSPTELINPKSALSGSNPVLRDTKHWFLPLNQYEDFLREWILKNHKEDWRSTVYGQCKSWIDMGLQPRAVTRDLEWGVKLPIPDTDGKVLYVWFDAPIGYISATKVWAEQNHKTWETYWKDKDSKLVHFIGKDNIVFHCIIFPVMLKAEGSYILPENVPANEFMNLENDKISTSRNWAVWLHEYMQDFPEKQDVLRYVLTSNSPETKDNDFTWRDFQAKNNNELLAIFGNFINRTVVLTHKYFKGMAPEKTGLNDSDKSVIEQMNAYPRLIGSCIEKYHFRESLNELMNLARLGNKYLTDNEPWKEINTNPERVQTVINIALQIVANLTILCEPFLPFTAKKLQKMLNLKPLTWADAGNDSLIPDGHGLKQPEFLFKKIEDDDIEKQLLKLQKRKEENMLNSQIEPQKELISYDDFSKMDLRICRILQAEKVAKTKKLLKLTVDTGIDKRTIISGIAEHYEPEHLLGKNVLMLINLQAKEIKGVSSQGMILMAENTDGELGIVTTDKDTAIGSVVK